MSFLQVTGIIVTQYLKGWILSCPGPSGEVPGGGVQAVFCLQGICLKPRSCFQKARSAVKADIKIGRF